MKKTLALLLTLIMMLTLVPFSFAEENEDITLKFLIAAGVFDIDSDTGMEVAQRVAGYKIDFEMINGTEQLMLIISSGQPYDYVFLNRTNFDLMYSNGALMDISELLEQYGQNIVEAFPTLWAATTFDGGIYAIPSTAAQPDSLVNSIVARKDLLDAIGYTEDKLPTTLDGFKTMLKDIKAAYPDMVPLTSIPDYIFSNIASAFNVKGLYELRDGKVESLVNNPNLEAYLTYMNELYAEGLLDAEMPAHTKATAQAKWSSGDAVLIYNSWNGIETPIGAMRELYPDMEWEVLPLLEDENGKVHAEMKYGATQFGGIPVTAEHPAEAIQAINNLIQIDNFKEIVLGVEGVHYTANDDGTYTPIQPAFLEEKNNSNIFVSGFYREVEYPTIWEARLKKNADLEKCFFDMRNSLLDGGERNPVALAPTVTVVDNKTALETRISDTLKAIICGTSDMSALAELQTYWADNGGTEIIEFYNEWYAENMNK